MAVLGATIVALGCASHAVRVPGDVRGYEIVVPGQDSLSRAFAQALSGAGFRVRRAVRGGNRPAAVLVHFVFSETSDAPISLYGRLADTRTGRIVAAAAVRLDASPAAARDSVPALVRALSTTP
jgi:hypothetical protein